MVSSINNINSNFNQLKISPRPAEKFVQTDIAEKKPSKQNKNTFANIIGAIIGLAAPIYLIKDELSKETPTTAKSNAEIMQSFLPNCESLENTKNTVNKIMEETGLNKKGVKLNIIEGEEGVQDFKRMIEGLYKNPNAYQRRKQNNWFELFSKGANAAYFHDSNYIVVHKDLTSSIYHEIGHAMNKQKGNLFNKAIIKGLHTLPHNISIFAPIILGIGLLHKPDKNKPKPEKSKLEKTMDFVSNNVGKLTAACYLPLMAEEGMASYKGLKLASKHLPKDVLQKIAGNYTKAYITYLSAPLLVAGGVALGVKTANYIKEHGEKQN